MGSRHSAKQHNSTTKVGPPSAPQRIRSWSRARDQHSPTRLVAKSHATQRRTRTQIRRRTPSRNGAARPLAARLKPAVWRRGDPAARAAILAVLARSAARSAAGNDGDVRCRAHVGNDNRVGRSRVESRRSVITGAVRGRRRARTPHRGRAQEGHAHTSNDSNHRSADLRIARRRAQSTRRANLLFAKVTLRPLRRAERSTGASRCPTRRPR